MKKRNWFRTLVILTWGLTMGLVAYAGQSGWGTDGQVDEQLAIRHAALEECSVSYRLAYVRELENHELVLTRGQNELPGLRPFPELVVFVQEDDGTPIHDAAVKYSVRSPEGRWVQARALPVGNGFCGGIFCNQVGNYQIEMEVTRSGRTMVDRFDLEVQ